MAALTVGAATSNVEFGSGFTVTLVTDSIEHHCELEVNVNMTAVGTYYLRCTKLDRETMNYEKRVALTRQQTGDLRALLQQARLFDGQYWGGDARGLDFSFETLTVHEGRVATLVTSFNDSFRSGTRKRLLDFLRTFMQTPENGA